jgi:hypothetical protein
MAWLGYLQGKWQSSEEKKLFLPLFAINKIFRPLGMSLTGKSVQKILHCSILPLHKHHSPEESSIIKLESPQSV